MIPYRNFIYDLTDEEITVLRIKSNNKKLVKMIHGSLIYQAKNKATILKEQKEKKENNQKKLIIQPPTYTKEEQKEHIRKIKEEFRERRDKHTRPKNIGYSQYTPEEFQKAMERKQKEHLKNLEKEQQRLLDVHPLMKKFIDEEYKKLEEERKKRIAKINKE